MSASTPSPTGRPQAGPSMQSICPRTLEVKAIRAALLNYMGHKA